MCSKEEAKQAAVAAINETLFKRDPDTGETRLHKEVDNHIEDYINKMVTKLTFRFGLSLMIVTAMATIAWMTLSFKVDGHDQRLNEGDRYTQEEHDAYAQYVETRFEDIDGDLKEIKQDVKDIRNAVVK
jgi:hypothetical protein